MPRNSEGIDISPKLLINLNTKKGKTYKEIADENDLTVGQVAGAIRYYKIKGDEPAPEELFNVDIGEPLEIEGDFMIVGDIHVPTTDYFFSQNIIPVAKKLGIENLVIAGDLFNMDLFSSYDEIVAHPTWKQEKDCAKLLIREWREYFKKIYFIMGNHERRPSKWASGQFMADDLMSLIDASDVISSNWGWCTVNTEAGKYRITHPSNYSVNQLTVADQLSHKMLMHIISAHEHHIAKGWDRYGNFTVTNLGGLFDYKKMAYVVLDDSKSAGMKKGFVALKNGVTHTFGEYPYTDWEMWK